jgi:hypothetical protein
MSFFEKPMAESMSKEIVHLLVGEAEHVLAEVLAQRPLVEDELDVEGGLGGAVDRLDLLVGEALGLERAGVDAGRLVDVAMTDGVGLDLGDLGFGVAERAQRLGHRG